MLEMLIASIVGFLVGIVVSFILVKKNMKLISQIYMADQVNQALNAQNEQQTLDTVLPSNGNPPPPPPKP